MNKFEETKIEIITFTAEDIITDSTCISGYEYCAEKDNIGGIC